MIKHFLLAWRFMYGESLQTRFVFSCFFMFQEKYRIMPLKAWKVGDDEPQVSCSSQM